MSIQEIANKITAKNWAFEIHHNGQRVGGKTKTSDAIAQAGDVATFIENVGKNLKADHLIVALFSPNGSSWLPKGTNTVVVSTNTVEPSTKVVERPTNHVEQFNGLGNAGNGLQAVIENGQLKTELRFLKEKTDEQKTRINDLERKNSTLHEENLKLTRENGNNSEKLDLELQKKTLEHLKEQKSGLSGIMKDLEGMNPETVATLVGIFNPEHKMVKMILEKSGTNQAALSGDGPKHPDADAQTCIEAIVKYLATGNVAAAHVGVLALIVDKLSKDQDKAVEILKQISEEKKPEEKTS